MDEHEFARGIVLGHIEANPGASFLDLMGSLSLPAGRLTFHLNELRKGQYIDLKQEGAQRYLFPRSKSRTRNHSSLRHLPLGFPRIDLRQKRIQGKMVRAIRNKPGITTTTLAEELGMSRKSVSGLAITLERRGSIHMVRIDMLTHWYVN